MVEHYNTDEKPVNGAQQDRLLPPQNGVSYNSEHPETIEISEVAKEEKTDTFKARTVSFLIKIFSSKACHVFHFICTISLAVAVGILLKYSPADQSKPSPSGRYPSGYNPCPQGWVLPKPSPSEPYPSCVTLCPQGWVVHGAWCYYFSTAEANWNSSQSYCSSYGGSLTAIDTPSEMKFLHSEKKATDYWIGLRREAGQPWKLANGSYFDTWFTIGANGQCAYLNDGNASSSWCITERHWICRRPHLSA